MTMNKIIIGFFIFISLGMSAFAQQDFEFSQYMFNGLVLNPAYSGSREDVSLVAFTRHQWVGFDGAPTNQSISIHGPTRNLRHGFGGILTHDQIGVARTISGTFTYAYRLPLGEKYHLALGLQGSLANHRVANGEVSTTTAGDPAFAGDKVNLILPGAGAGLYFHSNRLYLGFSVPNFIPNSLAGDNAAGLAKRSPHFLFTGGIVFDLGQNVKLRPSFLLKMVQGAPPEADLNLHFLFVEKLWLGASYRTGDALVFMAEWQVSRVFRFGFAYDLTLTKLSDYNVGTFEGMIGFDFGGVKHNMTSPRYF